MSDRFIPYGRQTIDDDDIEAVVRALKSDWLTTGPEVPAFEAEFAAYVGALHGVAVSNGTAALHLTMLAAGIGRGDEVIVSDLTFAASANAARYVGADVVFADVREDTLTIDAGEVERLITAKTRAIVAVDYAGVPCDLDELAGLAQSHGLLLIEDACHAPGATYRGRQIGSIADMSIFSFHPVKHMTTTEGGLVTTNDDQLAARLAQFRNHGITTDFRSREEKGTWEYDMVDLGFNYRLPDLACALGRTQLKHMDDWVAARRAIADRYALAFSEVEGVQTIEVPDDREASWHIYPIRFTGPDPAAVRRRAFEAMREAGIGVNVHYLPVHLHSYYRDLGYEPGLCPVAEKAYDGLLTLPMWPGLTQAEQARVIEMVSDYATVD